MTVVVREAQTLGVAWMYPPGICGQRWTTWTDLPCRHSRAAVVSPRRDIGVAKGRGSREGY